MNCQVKCNKRNKKRTACAVRFFCSGLLRLCAVGSLLLACCADVYAADRGLEEADLGARLAGLDRDGIVLDGDDLADDTADGGDLVADGKGITHVLRFLLLLLLRTDHQKIEDRDHRDQHDRHGKRRERAAFGSFSRACGCVQKEIEHNSLRVF